MLWAVPWIGLALIAYDIIVFAFSTSGLAGALETLQAKIFSVPLMSGVSWTLNIADALILFTLVMLFVELIKATRRRGNSITDHALSTIIFIICMIQFLMVEKAATSVFFVITAVAFIDVIAGFFITIRAARRDLTLAQRSQA